MTYLSMQYFTVFVSLNFNLLIFWSSLEFQIKRNFWDQKLFNTNLKILFYFIFPIFILNIVFFFKQVNTFKIHINVLFNDIYHNLNFKKKMQTLVYNVHLNICSNRGSEINKGFKLGYKVIFHMYVFIVEYSWDYL